MNDKINKYASIFIIALTALTLAITWILDNDPSKLAFTFSLLTSISLAIGNLSNGKEK